MPDLEHSLHSQDLGYLKIIADMWGLELNVPDTRSGLTNLIGQLANAVHFEQMLLALPETGRGALNEIAKNHGRLPWATFTRLFGDVREMGIARRDREKPHKDPTASAAEMLWYRGLIGRSFFDTSEGLLEFAFIPDEILALIPNRAADNEERPDVRLALSAEQEIITLADDSILDDVCTLLAGLRSGITIAQLDHWMICARTSAVPLWADALRLLLKTAGLITQDGSPEPDSIRMFLEGDRVEMLPWLFNHWIKSREFDEVRMLPGLQAEGEWINNPYRSRQTLIDYLVGFLRGSEQDEGSIKKSFWSLSSFVSWVHETHPDFQRSAGDFDSWYVYDTRADRYLRGIEDWDLVDGALLRFLIGGPLHWLGAMDLGFKEKTGTDRPILASFRFTSFAETLIFNKLQSHLKPEKEVLIVKSDGRISANRMTPRSVRYQVARFCEWDRVENGTYHYLLTPKSLEAAKKQGLTIQHVLAILGKAAKALPPGLVQALKRWENAGSEAYFEQMVVLRVKDPEIIQKLRNSRAARFLGDPLGPAAIVVRSGSWKIVYQALTEMGLLSYTNFEGFLDYPASIKKPD